jgi:cytoskeletal protein CcmA (bactofilin family)
MWGILEPAMGQPRLPVTGHISGGLIMFNKKIRNDEDSKPIPPMRIGEQQPIRSKNVSVIGPTLIFRGELSADEDLVIEGTIEGTIAHHKKNLTIGAKGRVSADIHASSVLVEGQLDGDIHSDGLVSLAKGAAVNGNIYCSRLVLQDGARFNGKVEMAKQPALKIAPKPEADEDSYADKENRSASVSTEKRF